MWVLKLLKCNFYPLASIVGTSKPFLDCCFSSQCSLLRAWGTRITSISHWASIVNLKPLALSGVRSIYSIGPTGRQCRRFQFLCQSITSYAFSKCFWTGHENQWDQPLLFQCPTDYVMSGVKSIHNNHREDRLWKFKCCKSSNKKLWVNCLTLSITGEDSYTAPATRCLWVPSATMTITIYAFCNLRTRIIPSHRDRQWKMLQCMWI